MHYLKSILSPVRVIQRFVLVLAMGLECYCHAQVTPQPVRTIGYGTLEAMVLSPDGTRLLTGGGAGAFLWDVPSGSVIHHFDGHQERVNSVALSPDGSRVLTGDYRGEARLWDAQSGEMIRKFGELVTLVAFSPDAKLVVTGHNYSLRVAKIWNAETGEIVEMFPFPESTSSVVFAPDGAHILFVPYGGGWAGGHAEAVLWDIQNAAIVRTFPAGTEQGCDVAFSSDGTRLLTTRDHGASMWDVETGENLLDIPKPGHGEEPFSLAFSPDGQRLAMGAFFWFGIYDTQTGEELLSVERHTSNIHSIGFFPDGQTLVTGGNDGMIKFWDLDTGSEVQSFPGHTPWITSIALSPDDGLLLTGHEANAGGTAWLWDMVSGQQLRQFGEDGVWAVAFSPNGAHIVTGGAHQYNPPTRVWDTATGRELMRLDTGGGVHSVAFSPDGQYLLTSGSSWNPSPPPRLWDAATGQEVRRFEGHSGEVYSITFSPNGDFVLTGSEDKTARLWDAHTGEEERRFVGHAGSVWSVAFSPDGKFVVTGSSDQTARLWDFTTGREILRLDGHSEDVRSVAVSPDGMLVLTGSYDRTARLWDTSTGEEVRQFKALPVRQALFTSDGRSVLAASGHGPVNVWDIRDLVASRPQPIRKFEGTFRSTPVSEQALSEDSRRIRTYDTGGEAVSVRDVATGALVRRFGGDGMTVYSSALSADGQLLATGLEDCAVLWNATTGEELRRLETEESGVVRSVAFSRDARYVLTTTDSTIARLWDTATGLQVAEYEHGDRVYSTELSPDGRRVVTCGSGLAVVHDTLTGTEIRRFDLDPWGPSAQFTPDGDRLVVKGLVKGTIHVWDIENGQEVQRIVHPFPGDGTFFALSPDGRQLLTGSFYDDTARLWDIASGEELLQFEPGPPRLWLSTLEFSPNGKLVITAYQTEDGPALDIPAILWDATTGRELRQLQGPPGVGTFADFSPDGRFVLSWGHWGGISQTYLWDIRDLVARPRFEQSTGGPEIHWNLGALQFAPTTTGPWITLPVSSPLNLQTIGDKGFFRVKVEEGN